MQRLEITNKADIDRSLPLVSIIGRPNVGKSTLFNRLIGKRRAITDPTPGVTRDPIPERWLLGNHPVTLVDSGGIKVDREGMDGLVSEESISLLVEREAIIFMLDCTETLHEVNIRMREHYLSRGGPHFTFVPAPAPEHFSSLCMSLVDSFLQQESSSSAVSQRFLAGFKMTGEI